MVDDRLLLQSAKTCWTKESWDRFLREQGSDLFALKDAKVVRSIFQHLQKDPQSLQYSPKLWDSLLRACKTCSDFALGREIANHCASIPSVQVALVAADIFMSSNQPAKARQVAARALRLSQLQDWEKLELQMTLCNTYVEEGKYAIASRHLEKLRDLVKESPQEDARTASILYKMSRSYFYLGQYTETSSCCHQAYQIFAKLGDWDEALRCLFNTAASSYNAGGQERKKAFQLVQECIALAKKFGKQNRLSYCYGFLGNYNYHQGNFSEAAKYLKLALQLQPEERSKLYISSTLALVHLKAGSFGNADKTAEILSKDSQLDSSEHLRPRYITINAQIAWQRGDLEASQQLLSQSCRPFFVTGVRRVDDLMLLSRYLLQCAQLGLVQTPTEVEIPDQIKANIPTWLDYQFSVSQVLITQRRFQEAKALVNDCIQIAKAEDTHYFYALFVLTILQIKMKQGEFDDQFSQLAREFELVITRTKNSPLKIQLAFFRASMSYRDGNLEETKRHLQNAANTKQTVPIIKIIVDSWLTTLKGYSPKISSPLHLKVLARMTALYFCPSLKYLGEDKFVVSDRYTHGFEKNSLISKLLQYLLTAPNNTASLESLQREVWEESITAQGWEQKIRNTLTRVRSIFSSTLAPLVLQNENQVSLFHEAVELGNALDKSPGGEHSVLSLLEIGPMSSVELSNKLHVSPATAKRLLKKLVEERLIQAEKIGRNVLYHSATMPSSQRGTDAYI